MCLFLCLALPSSKCIVQERLCRVSCHRSCCLHRDEKVCRCESTLIIGVANIIIMFLYLSVYVCVCVCVFLSCLCQARWSSFYALLWCGLGRHSIHLILSGAPWDLDCASGMQKLCASMPWDLDCASGMQKLCASMCHFSSKTLRDPVGLHHHAPLQQQNTQRSCWFTPPCTTSAAKHSEVLLVYTTMHHFSSKTLNLNLNDYVEVPRSLVLYDVGGLR